MANLKISELPSATTPLTGNEKAEIVQGGINKQVDVSEFGGGTTIPFGSATGTNSYSATMTPAVSTYTNGGLYTVRVANNSTGVVTFDLGAGAKKAINTNGGQMQDGFFKTGVTYLLSYDSALDSGTGAFVVANEIIHGLMNLRGSYDASANQYPTSGGSGPSGGIRHGDTWIVSVAGTLSVGVAVIAGDMITTGVDNPGQTASLWYVIPGRQSLATKANTFVETATAYVSTNGSDVTGTLGRYDLPYATITGALQANTGVASLKIKIGMGTFASPAVADTRANLWLEGSGKPGYNNSNTLTAFATITITDPTALVGGTILQGQLYFQDKSNVHITDLGVDCGSAYVTGGGTEANQIAFLSATTNFNFTLMRNIVIKNVTTLGRTAGSLFHAIQIENGFKPIIQNCDTYFSTHGIVLKCYGGIVNNVRCNFHTLDAVIFKTDTYALGWINQLSNFEVQGGGGVLVDLGSGTSTGGVNGTKISNGILRSPSFGVKTNSQTATMIHYIDINNVTVYGSSGVGFDIEESQSVQVNNCLALACTTGFEVSATATNTFCSILNCRAESCTTGFDISATSSSAIIRNCAARGNTNGFTFAGTIYASGLIWDTNTNNFSGSSAGLPIYFAPGRTFIGGTSSPTALLHVNSGSTSLAPAKIAAGALLTSALGGSLEYGPDTTTGAYYLTKASDLRHGVGGVIYDSFADVQNSGTTETDMFSYTTPANTLAGNGEKLRAKYAGTFNDNTATAQMKVLFDGQTAFDSGALTIANTGSWEIDVLIVRTGSTTARSIVTMTTNSVATRTYTTQTDLTSLTLTTTSILKLTATAGGGGGGSNDITGKMATVSWFPVAAN